MTLQKRLKEARVVAEVISAPILATVVTLALGTGVVLKNADDIYDLGRIFYEHNKNTWEDIELIFQSSVCFNKTTNKLSVDKPFIDIVKNTFNKVFKPSSSNNINTFYLNGIPYTYCISIDSLKSFVSPYTDYSINKEIGEVRIGDILIKSSTGSFTSGSSYSVYDSNGSVLVSNSNKIRVFVDDYCNTSKGAIIDYDKYYYYFYTDSGFYLNLGSSSAFVEQLFGGLNSLDYTGTYNGGFLDTDQDIYIPGNLDSSVGANPSDVVGDNAPGWVGNGDISLPTVDNPSISVDGSTSFPMGDNTNGSIDIEYNKTVWSNGDLITADKLNNIEDALEALCTTTENYIKTIWKDNDLITEEKLNKIENAIAVLSPSYKKTNWSNGDIIIAELLNKIENAIEAL